jgi:polyferredoxin
VALGGLFVIVLFGYELFDWWGDPRATGLIVAYFVGALAVDLLFEHASFCKFVCPIGQFNFVASTVSPLEVRVADPATCDSCATKDCIRGRRDASSKAVVVRGCELALFQPHKRGNVDCTFCPDCVHACPTTTSPSRRAFREASSGRTRAAPASAASRNARISRRSPCSSHSERC